MSMPYVVSRYHLFAIYAVYITFNMIMYIHIFYILYKWSIVSLEVVQLFERFSCFQSWILLKIALSFGLGTICIRCLGKLFVSFQQAALLEARFLLWVSIWYEYIWMYFCKYLNNQLKSIWVSFLGQYQAVYFAIKWYFWKLIYISFYLI